MSFTTLADLVLAPSSRPTSGVELRLISTKQGKSVSVSTPPVISPFGVETPFGKPRLNLSLDLTWQGVSDLYHRIAAFERLFEGLPELQGYALVSSLRDEPGPAPRKMLRASLTSYKGAITTKVDGNYMSTFDKSKKLTALLSMSALWIDHDAKTYGIKVMVKSVSQKGR